MFFHLNLLVLKTNGTQSYCFPVLSRFCNGLCRWQTLGADYNGVARGRFRGFLNTPSRRTNRQQRRDNKPAQTPPDYYKWAVAISLLDHLQSEMKTHFNPTNDAVLSSLFNLLPELVAVGDRNPDIEAVRSGVLWEWLSFSSCGWCWAPAMEEKVVQHWGCRPSHQCSSETRSMRSTVLS